MPIYDDDGTEIDPRSVPLPSLCKRCEKLDDLDEQLLCDLNRVGQRNDPEFKCYAFVSVYGVLTDDIIS